MYVPYSYSTIGSGHCYNIQYDALMNSIGNPPRGIGSFEELYLRSEKFDVSRSQWTNQHNKAQWLWPNVVENVHAGILRCLLCAHSLFFCLVSILCLNEYCVRIGWNLNWDVCIVPTYIGGPLALSTVGPVKRTLNNFDLTTTMEPSPHHHLSQL